MITELVLFFALLFLIIRLNKRPPDYPPGRWGIPVLGSLPLPPRGQKLLQFLKDCQKQYGDIFSLRFGSLRMVYLCNAKLIKEAFSKAEISGRPSLHTYKVQHIYENLGLVFSSGYNWQTNRRFTLSHLRDFGLGRQSMEGIISGEVEAIIKEWSKFVNKPLEVDRSLNIAALNVIWQIVAAKRYELDDDNLANHTKEVIGNIQAMDGPLIYFNFFPWLKKLPLPRFIVDGWMKSEAQRRSAEVKYKYLEAVVEEHDNSLDEKNPRDFIDVYLIEMKKEENNGRFPKENLVISLINLFTAGSDTTASTLRWFLLYMAAHPIIQERVYREIVSVVGKEVMPSLGDKERLPYTEATIHEIGRVVSLLPLVIAHSVTEDTEVAGYKLPKGTVVNGVVQFCHRSPRHWEKPDDFYPEHFLDEDGNFDGKKDGFMPFSIGRRLCLGESVAKMELFLFASGILQRYKIEPLENSQIDLEKDPEIVFFNWSKPQQIILRGRE